MSDPINPECRAGKHRNCDGSAWCFERDIPVGCYCECHEGTTP